MARADIVAGFPSPVRTVCWSQPANALFASGAFRIAGWSMTAPPFGGETSGALETGRAGLVLVEAVAAHPEKKLIAAGYANGRITIAQIGARDELLVRPLGSAVTALAWSGDGRHLAVGVCRWHRRDRHLSRADVQIADAVRMKQEDQMQTELTAEDKSKDEFFERLADLSEEMVAKHGKDFSMGALVLAARWIAENRVGKLKTN